MTGKYKRWIELEAAQMCVQRNIIGNGSGKGANKKLNPSSISEIVIVKKYDALVPNFLPNL